MNYSFSLRAADKAIAKRQASVELATAFKNKADAKTAEQAVHGIIDTLSLDKGLCIMVQCSGSVDLQSAGKVGAAELTIRVALKRQEAAAP